MMGRASAESTQAPWTAHFDPCSIGVLWLLDVELSHKESKGFRKLQNSPEFCETPMARHGTVFALLPSVYSYG